MKKIEGKFVLYDVAEFADWLNSAVISRVIRLIQDHHTFSPAYAHFDGNNHFSLLRGMERFHIAERGFSEIAQNLTVFPDGTVALCRSLEKIPAGIQGANARGICIENVGNFDAGKDAMREEQRAAIIEVNALLCRKFGIRPDSRSIVYHHWFDLNTGERTNGTGVTKSCPGTNFFGGNRVEDAEANFIPLIANRLQFAGDSEPPANILFRARVTADSLNVRAKPDASSRKIKALTQGVAVNVFEQSGNWRRIDERESQWVNGRFLERISD